jgi:hypothetical protein
MGFLVQAPWYPAIREMINNCTPALVVLAMVVSTSLAEERLTLATNGRTDYVIVVGDDAIASEMTAARELAGYLAKVTGAQFPIMSEADAPAGEQKIMVGQTVGVRNLLPGIDWKALGHDGIVMKTSGDRLLLAGGRPRGTLYAVYTFLEDVVGCRWWTSREEYVPQRPTLAIRRLDSLYVPKLKYRETYYQGVSERFLDVRQTPEFAVKLKSNGHFQRIADELGGNYELIGWCHTFNQLLPPDKYFKEHPQWYSQIGGKRVVRSHSDSQLCLTNMEMRKELTRVVLEAIRANPQAGIISVSQNDGYGQCQCAQCTAAAQREGSHAGPLVELVNAVAEEVEREFPDFLVETLAYHWTRKPPVNVRPRRNVLIRLTGLECDFAQPVDSDANASYRDDIKGWSAIAPNLFIWHYVANYANYNQPHPNIFNIGRDVRFFVDNRAVGVFVEGDGVSPVGDFVRLRAWVVAHMLWDPSRDPVELAREFTGGYYGPAGRHIFDYLKLAHNAVKRSGMRLSYGNCDTSFFSLAEMNQASRLFDMAEAAVQHDATLLARVRRDRLAFDLVWLKNWVWLQPEAKRTNQAFLGPADLRAACADYLLKFSDAVKSHFEPDPPTYYAARMLKNDPPALRALCAKQLEFIDRKASVLPAEVQGLAEDQYLIFQMDTYQQALWDGGVTVLSELVDDPLASDGKAAHLAVPWAAARIHVQAYFAGRWRCYVQLRCRTTEHTGAAFQLGVYDLLSSPKRELGVGILSLTDVEAGGYRTYDTGVYDLRPGMYLHVTMRPEAKHVEAVYVDRFILVRAADQ